MNNGYQQPHYQQQPIYQQPMYQQPNTEMEEVVSTSNWFWSMLLLSIFPVNIIMMFVWAFGTQNRSKANFGKAMLIWCLVGIGIGIIGFVIMAVIGLISGIGLAAILNDMVESINSSSGYYY